MNKVNKEQMKAGIDIIISSIYLEESAREFRSKIIMREKIDMHDERTKKFSINGMKNKDTERVIEACKILNSHIEQLMIKRKGDMPINEMAYNLLESFRELSYLSIPDQGKVKEFIKGLYECMV